MAAVLESPEVMLRWPLPLPLTGGRGRGNCRFCRVVCELLVTAGTDDHLVVSFFRLGERGPREARSRGGLRLHGRLGAGALGRGDRRGVPPRREGADQAGD